jgi:putative phage-type endonuclease
VTLTTDIEHEHFVPIYRGRDRKKFLQARSLGIGASDIAAVLGFSKWRTPYEVWLDKTGRAPERDMTEFMEWGIALEAPIARRFQSRHGRLDAPQPIGRVRPSPGVLQSRKYPWLLATPDRIVEEFETGLAVPLEIKTQNAFGRDEWAEAPPLYYQSQSQAQQIVWFGPDPQVDAHGLVIPLIGGNSMPEPFTLPFDREFAEFLIDDVGRWFHDHVVKDVPPPLTVADDIAGLMPPVDGKTITADSYIKSLIEERTQILRPRLSKDEKRDAEIKAELKLAMLDATSIVDENGATLVTWALPRTAPKTVDEFDEAAFRAVHPALAAEFTTRVTKPQTRSMQFK